MTSLAVSVGNKIKPRPWNLNYARVDPRYRSLWHGCAAAWPLWEGGDGTKVLSYPGPRRWELNNGARFERGRNGLEVYFPGGGANEINPVGFAGIFVPQAAFYTMHLVLRPYSFASSGSQRQGFMRNSGTLWIMDDNAIWGRHSSSNHPSAGGADMDPENEGAAGNLITLTRTWNGSVVRQWGNGVLRDETSAPSETPASWTLTHWGWQNSSADELVDTSILFAAIWVHRSLTSGEVALLNADPFGMFRPMSPIYLGAASSGGGGEEPSAVVKNQRSARISAVIST